MTVRLSIVVNPRAGAGSAARKLVGLRRTLTRLGLSHEILETRHPGHAVALARSARSGGCELLVVLGGDGTLNEVSQAYIDAAGMPLPGPPLALIPAGTGGDFARACGLDEAAALRAFEALSSAR